MSIVRKFGVRKFLSLRPLALALCATLPLLSAACARADESPRALPAPVVDNARTGTTETAVLSGGCFWGMQGVFEHVKGVRQVLAGYSGGQKSTAEYEQVSTGDTGHAESVQIIFDPKQVTYGQILRVYFSVASDPTELNRQGPGLRHAIPRRYFRGQRCAEAHCRCVYRAARKGARIREPDRHARRSPDRVLSGRGLSSGLPDPQSRQPLHRHQRPA